MGKISVLLANLTVRQLDSRSTSFLFSSSIVIWGPQPAVLLRNTKKYIYSAYLSNCAIHFELKKQLNIHNGNEAMHNSP